MNDKFTPLKHALVHFGCTGVGKSFVACALAQKACRDGYSALYTRPQTLFRDLAMARADGSLRGLWRDLAALTCLTSMTG
jgi:DNA replication protein DnaC